MKYTATIPSYKIRDIDSIHRDFQVPEVTLYGDIRKDSTKDHSLSPEIQKIIHELSSIALFVREISKFGFSGFETLGQIHRILNRLRGGDHTYRYTEMVQVLMKYLGGLRDFSKDRDMRDILSYKQLFESTLVAIMREVNGLEENPR